MERCWNYRDAQWAPCSEYPTLCDRCHRGRDVNPGLQRWGILLGVGLVIVVLDQITKDSRDAYHAPARIHPHRRRVLQPHLHSEPRCGLRHVCHDQQRVPAHLFRRGVDLRARAVRDDLLSHAPGGRVGPTQRRQHFRRGRSGTCSTGCNTAKSWTFWTFIWAATTGRHSTWRTAPSAWVSYPC